MDKVKLRKLVNIVQKFGVIMLAPHAKRAMSKRMSIDTRLMDSSINTGVFYSPKGDLFNRLPLVVNKSYRELDNIFKNKKADLDLSEHYVKDPKKTFMIRVQGNSMIEAGIKDGDMLLVDKSMKAASGKIVVASLDGKITVKRLKYDKKGTLLVSENRDYKNIRIEKGTVFEIWGVVTSVIKAM